MNNLVYSKRQKAAMIISVILGLIIYINFLYGESLPFFYQSVINISLSFGILVCFILGYKVPTQITLNVFDYWFVLFPLAFILLLFGLIWTYEQIAINSQMKDFVPVDKFFKIGLGIAVMTSLGSIFVQINADKRLRKIEKEIFNKNSNNNLSELIKKEVERQLALELTKQKEKTNKEFIMDERNLKDYLMKEVDMIQSILKRMSHNSFLIKGWTITLVIGSLLLERSMLEGSKLQIFIAFIPLLVFWFLDAYFLRQERMYRKLYDWVITNRLNTNENLFNMNARRFEKEVGSIPKTMFSVTLRWFYGSIFILTAVYVSLICYYTK